MPRKLKFVKNSVIYFRGELSRDIFLISEGSVVISSDIQVLKEGDSHQKIKVGKGKFFGLHSAIGNTPRQNDVISATDVSLVAFNVEEFEELVTKSPKLSLQFMRMLSQELRQVHKESQGIAEVLIATVDPEEILFSYVESYHKQNDDTKTKYVGECYLRIFPLGNHVESVQSILEDLK